MKKLYTLIVITTLLAVSGSVFAQNFGILLAEDFESGALPADWTRSQAVGSDGWTFGVTSYSSTYWDIPTSIDNSQFAVSNDDDCNCDMSDDQLNSPLLDLSNFDSAYFLFDRFFDGQYSSEAYFQISYDGGVTWLYLALTADPAWVEDGVILPATITVDNVNYTFNNNMKIGFLHYDGETWASGFAVDNVVVAGFNTPCDDIITIANCGAAQTVSLGGQGVLDFNFTGPCGWDVPGAEQLYSFTPTTTGIYTLDITSTTGVSWLDYMFKPASLGCDSLDWTCLDDVNVPGSYGMSLTAGVEYLILVDNEFIDEETQTFTISCPCTYTSQGNPSESESCGADLNGGCNNDPSPETYEPITCGASISGTLWADGGNRDTDWFELVVTEATDIVIDYSGGMPINAILIDDCTNFTVFGEATSFACGSGSITYSATPGTYVLAIVPTAFEAYPCGSGSANQYDLTVTFCNAPANDLCVNAEALSCGSSVVGSTDLATSTGASSCQNVGLGLWYTFVGDGSQVVLSTDNAGTDFDTYLGVTESCGGPCFASDDDGGTGTTSEVSFTTVNGQTYYVQVSGYNSTGSGNFELSLECISAPSNDNVCSAAALSLGSNGPFSNVGATSEVGEAIPGGGTGGNSCQSQDGWCSFELVIDNSIWFTFVAPASGSVTIDTDGSDDDTQLAVYSAATCGDLLTGDGTLLGANDDNVDYVLTQFSSLVNLCGLTPGNTYYVQVDGYNGASGDVMVNVSENTLDASFTSSETNLDVVFTDASTSSGTVVSWAWDFGDGTGTSTDQNPSYSYGSGNTYTVCLTVTDAQGCESTFCQDVTVTDIPTSIAEAVENGMAVYPNPSNGEFTVEINGVEADVQLVVLDVAGRVVYTEGVALNGSFRKTMNVEVASGTYFLQIATAEGLVTRKLQIH